MTTELTIPEFKLPALVIPPDLQSEIDRLLAVPALWAKCDTAEENQKIADARGNLDRLAKTMEKSRKKITDPVNGWVATVKAAVDTAKEPMLQEIGRLDALTSDYTRRQEQLRREREEAQRREIERIAAAERAEIARLAREQADREAQAARAAAEAERVIREAQEAANRAAAEARGKAAKAAAAELQRQADIAAEAGRVAREEMEARLAAERAANEQAMAQVQQGAAEAASIAAKPVDRTTAKGQTARKVWKITQINDFVLIKSRPDLVRKIEWDMVALKAALDETGKNLPGVTAVEDFTMGSRGKRPGGFIEA